MAEKEAHPTAIPLNINRGLTDKLVEKRKAAAIELERYNSVSPFLNCMSFFALFHLLPALTV